MEVFLPRVTKADKKIRLNMNTYRNLHPQVNSQVKRLYTPFVADALNNPLSGNKDIIQAPINIHLQAIFPTKGRRDSSNFYYVIEKFFLDSLVQLNMLEDDSDEFVHLRTHHKSMYVKGIDTCVVMVSSSK